MADGHLRKVGSFGISVNGRNGAVARGADVDLKDILDGIGIQGVACGYGSVILGLVELFEQIIHVSNVLANKVVFPGAAVGNRAIECYVMTMGLAAATSRSAATIPADTTSSNSTHPTTFGIRHVARHAAVL